jgi:hypothetical protein
MAVLGQTLHAVHPALERWRQTSLPLFKKVLLVEPDRHAMAALEKTWSSVSFVECCTDFQAGRRKLLEDEPNLLVTNLYLGAFNGLHLVYLAAASGLETRCVAYANVHNPALARETQCAGAFYERLPRLPFVPGCYAFQVLPPSDRRDPGVVDRRLNVRGGRRVPEVVTAS